MKNKELIERLEKCDPEAVVVVINPIFGWNAVKFIQERHATEEIEWGDDTNSSYFEYFQSCPADDEDAKKVILLEGDYE